MSVLRIPALEIKQGANTLYTFAIDGKQIHSFAAVSRIKRDEFAQLGGYQRPEVLSHIANIRSYMESAGAMIPNAVVLAFDSSVSFEHLHGSALDYASYGVLIVPIAEDKKPGFIVDGQQRLAAVREANVPSFPLCVTAFIADASQQMEQFILVNSTKPLPKSLIYELLPETNAALPSALQKRRLPSYLLSRLNHEEGSPLFEKIQTTTNPSGTIKDNSFLKHVEQSLSDGALYFFRKEEQDDTESMLALLRAYWGAVRSVFRKEWDFPPRKSRLLHGAGVIALGLLMDAICYSHKGEILTEAQFVTELSRIAPICRWTEGHWQFELDTRRWNDIQNTPKDIALLSGYLSRQYRKVAP